MNRRRLLVVDDHALFREAISALLHSMPDVDVVGEAGDGRDALRKVNALNPNVVLMDLAMPGTSGTEAIRAIKRRQPDVKVIALTLHKTQEHLRATLDAGADGYVLKNDSRNELVAAIESVGTGKTYLSPAICGEMVQGYLDGSGTPAPNHEDALTHREREVLKLIAEGFRNREIADYLGISPKTVEKHRANLMQKLDLHNASVLTAYAIRRGLVAA